jgi:putative tryptophan/tyrosine transport system substrate-binding protein
MKLTLHALAVMVLAVLAMPVTTDAQQPAKVPRIGFLRAGPPPRDFVEGFRQGLRELGYLEGQNLIIDYRFTDGTTTQLANLGAELLQRRVDVVLASGTEAVLAMKTLTATVPIVLAGVNDPVDSGLVSSLSRPGGNITGVSLMSVDLVSKRVQLLKEVVPRLSRFAVLGHPAHPSYTAQIRAAEAAAKALGIQLEIINVSGPNDFEAAFKVARRGEALVHLDDVLFTSHRTLLVELALDNRLPAIYGFRGWVEAGEFLAALSGPALRPRGLRPN